MYTGKASACYMCGYTQLCGCWWPNPVHKHYKTGGWAPCTSSVNCEPLHFVSSICSRKSAVGKPTPFASRLQLMSGHSDHSSTAMGGHSCDMYGNWLMTGRYFDLCTQMSAALSKLKSDSGGRLMLINVRKSRVDVLSQSLLFVMHCRKCAFTFCCTHWN